MEGGEGEGDWRLRKETQGIQEAEWQFLVAEVMGKEAEQLGKKGEGW
jgi:hypothetical protein